MDYEYILQRYDHFRSTAQFAGMQREETPYLVRHLTGQGEGMILYSQLDAQTADPVIQAQIDYFAQTGRDFEWVVYAHDTPPDLFDRLIARGLEPAAPETILVLDLDQAPAALKQPIRHDCRRLKTAAEIDEVIAIREAVWRRDFSQTARSLAARLTATPHDLALYLAYIDGVPAATAQITFYGGNEMASLGSAATLPAYRGRGLYTALLAVRVQAAGERGVKYLDCEANEVSRPILNRYGFQKLTTATLCEWSPPIKKG